MPSRSGAYSTRRSRTLLAWRFSMLTGWCRSRQIRAFARNRAGTRSPAGQPRAGVRRLRVQEMRLHTRGAGRVEVGGFVDHDPGVLPRNAPGLQRGQCQRQSGGERVGFREKRAGSAFADRQDARDLSGHGHVLGGVFLRRQCGCGHGSGGVGISCGKVHFQGGHSWLPPGPLQPCRPGTHPPDPEEGPQRPGPGFSPRRGPKQPAQRQRPRRPPTSPQRLCFPYAKHLRRHRQ